MTPLFLLALSAPGATEYARADDSARFGMPSGTVVVTHASRHYHTGAETIEATRILLEQAYADEKPVIALAQEKIASDPLWYAGPGDFITREFFSHGGEHPLFAVPDSRGHARVTAIGGYHSACLGWTLSELVSRFLASKGARELDLDLPMRAIYTGFLFDVRGQLVPRTPEDEANLDDSIDGLNLEQATRAMSDEDWSRFMRESLRIAVFRKAPMLEVDLSHARFILLRDGRELGMIQTEGSATPSLPLRKVVFRYRSR